MNPKFLGLKLQCRDYCFDLDLHLKAAPQDFRRSKLVGAVMEHWKTSPKKTVRAHHRHHRIRLLQCACEGSPQAPLHQAVAVCLWGLTTDTTASGCVAVCLRGLTTGTTASGCVAVCLRGLTTGTTASGCVAMCLWGLTTGTTASGCVAVCLRGLTPGTTASGCVAVCLWNSQVVKREITITNIEITNDGNHFQWKTLITPKN